MRQALDDPALLGATLVGDSWAAWRVLLIAAMGERLTRAERALFAKLTGRSREPGNRVEELWAVIGRRGGKSRAMSVLAAYLGALCAHSDRLAPGETGIVLCIAPDQKQAGIVLNYCEAAFRAAPILAQLIANRTSDTLELTTGISIEVRASSFRRLRGPTYIAVLADEAAFWHSDESANPDTEILNAVRPGLSTTGGMLVCASSPYARRGELWNAHRRHYGRAGDKLILVAAGASRVFNPTLSQRVVDRAFERDPAAAAAEYLAQFRTDVEAFISREVVEAAVSRGVFERAPLSGIEYFGFVDPSGGSSDSFTLAISHREGERAVLDAVREVRPPFSPENVASEFAGLLKRYRVSFVYGDRYAGEWPREQFRKRGVEYFPAAKAKSDLYIALLPALNSRAVDLLDHGRLVTQLVGLERRTSRAGRDSIEHAPGSHDDIANAASGALYLVLSKQRDDQYETGLPIVGGVDSTVIRIDPEFADYGRRLWEVGLMR
jgi:hypothetical protein